MIAFFANEYNCRDLTSDERGRLACIPSITRLDGGIARPTFDAGGNPSPSEEFIQDRADRS